MSTLFTKIVKGEIPCHKVLESDKFLAFLDIMPIKKGHVLVIPKVEVDYLFSLEDDLLGEMMVFAKQVAKKIERVFPCNRIGVTVIGLEVPHAHIHLIPINALDDMNFAKEKLNLSAEELASIASKIAEA
ncbi:MAG: HIT family protein [Crocinitomicaceae bacterium]|nr:HIT family protein [Crocinitomicaceae bacterium]MDG1777613.1 HIT family protein [Crocinitomicaceae bacterium]